MSAIAPKRSDIPLASAERLAASDRNAEERERVRAAAYHRQNVAIVDLNETLPWEIRETVTAYANRRWGARSEKTNSAGDGK